MSRVREKNKVFDVPTTISYPGRTARAPAIRCAVARPRAAGSAGRRILERRAWRCLLADGLPAMALGCVLAGAGAVSAIEAWLSPSRLVSAAVFAVSVGFALLVLVAGKRWVTAPRMVWASLGRIEQNRARGTLPVLGAGAALAASETLGTPLPLFACAVAVLAAGAVRLAGFIRRYPLPGEAGHGDVVFAVSPGRTSGLPEQLSIGIEEA